jgi:microcystin-dependent protein
MATGIVLGVVGAIKMFAGANQTGFDSEPIDGWLDCNGAAISRTTFAKLFAVIGTSYGAGDGSTTFNIPNFISRFPRQGTPGTTGGLSQVVLTASNLPSHSHSATFNSAGSHTHSVTFDAEFHTHTTGSYAADTNSHASDTAGTIMDVEVLSGGGTYQPFNGTGYVYGVSNFHTHSCYIPNLESHYHTFGSDITPPNTNSGSDSFGNALAANAHDNIPQFTYVNFIIKY